MTAIDHVESGVRFPSRERDTRALTVQLRDRGVCRAALGPEPADALVATARALPPIADPPTSRRARRRPSLPRSCSEEGMMRLDRDLLLDAFIANDLHRQPRNCEKENHAHLPHANADVVRRHEQI